MTGQTREERAALLEKIKRRSDLGKWQGGPAHILNLRLTTVDSPEVVSAAALETLIDYSRDAFDLEFELVGGGVGCFDMILGAEAGRSDEVERAILEDPHFQMLLNDLNIHIARIRTPAGTRTFAAHKRIKMGFVTNREIAGDKAVVPEALFGGALSKEPAFGIAEFLVLDLSHAQPRASFAKRIWRKITLALGDIRSGRQEAFVDRIDLLDEMQFHKLLEQSASSGVLVCVHGYANDFADAMHASARLIYRSSLEQLNVFPIIFSWPSFGSSARYLPDTQAAANSQIPLGKIFAQLGQLPKSKAISILAHSHGCKIVLEALYALPKPGKPRFSRFILVEPDVDANYLADRIGELMRAGEGLTLYHSANDRALALSEKALFKTKRAGQVGLPSSASDGLPATVELIDASRVASGLMRHAPHLDSVEVIRDIRDVVEGKPPASRQYLEPMPQPNHWRIRPA